MALTILAFAIVTRPANAGEQAATQQDPGRRSEGPTLGATSHRVPVGFEQNCGQAAEEVKFLGGIGGQRVLFTAAAVQFTLVKLHEPSADAFIDPSSRVRRPPEAVAHVTFAFEGARPNTQVVGGDLLPGKVRYMVGPESHWLDDVRLYAKVRYEGLFPGVDAVFYDAGGWLKYDFLVSPGADPERIRLRVEGGHRLRLTEQGDLVVETRAGQIYQRRPFVYQESGGTREEVTGGFVITGNTVGLALGPYDASRPLVIDPQIGYSTYLGGNRDDQGFFPGLGVDAEGNAYVSGETDSAMGQLSGRTTRDAFVAKIDPQGQHILFLVYLGGTGDDRAYDIFVDAERNVYLTGTTSSPNFTGADPSGYVSNPPLFVFDTFLVKLSPNLGLIYSRYFGLGSGFAVAADQAGNAYLSAGRFVDKFDPSGSHLGTASFFNDGATTTRDLRLDALANIYATGHHAPSAGALPDAFVARVSANMGSTTSVVLPSGGGQGIGWALAMDAASNVYVAGEMNPDPNIPSQLTDAFVAKLTPELSLVYLTHIGGSDWDQARGVAADGSGRLYLTGPTASSNFPTQNPFTTPVSVGSFVVKLMANTAEVVWSTLIGGNSRGEATSIAVDGLENLYVHGRTSSTTGLIGSGGLQPTYGGGSFDEFLIQIRQEPTLEISLLPATTRWKPQRNTTTNIDIHFSSVSPLKNATITITGPTTVAPIQATFDPANPPNPYVITWAGPWTSNPNDPASYLARGDYRIVVTGVKANNSVVESSPTDPNSTVSLVEVMRVEFLAADEDPRPNPLTENPAIPPIEGQSPPQDRPAEGKRMFAEGLTPAGTVFNRVKVHATVAPTITDLRGQAAVTVYFRSLDVDDPAIKDPNTGTTNLADADGDNVPLDAYNVHDNRGDPTQGSIVDHLEVPSGETAVTAVLQTSVQPGDNYRVVASTSTTWRDDLRAHQPSHVGEIRHYSNDATLTQDEKNSVSDMLTVWRTLHLEVDSMGAPPTNPNHAERNFLRGRVTGFALNGSGPPGIPPDDPPPPPTAFLDADDTVPPLEVADGSPDLTTGGQGRFEKGTLCIGAIAVTPLQANGDCTAPAVTVRPLAASGTDRVEFGDEIAIPCRLETPTGSTASCGAILWDGARFQLSGRVSSTFAGGTLDLGGVRFRITSVYTEGPTIPPPTTTYVDVEPGSELRFHLVDDDAATHPFSVSSSLLTDCAGDALCEADPARNIFAQAYVTVRYDLPSVQALASFKRNVPHVTAEVKDQLGRGRDAGTVSSLGYWAGYLQGAFQEDVLSDGDPDLENLVFVIAGVTADFVATFGSLVFVEAIRDYSALPGASCAFELIITETMAHELGHQFGLRDSEGGIMTQGCNLPHYFEAYSLGTIRNRRDPQ